MSGVREKSKAIDKSREECNSSVDECRSGVKNSKEANRGLSRKGIGQSRVKKV